MGTVTIIGRRNCFKLRFEFFSSTVTFLEEDIYGSHAKIMLDYFLAEGIVNDHSTLVASLDMNPYNIVN